MSKKYNVFRLCMGLAALLLLGSMWFFSSQTGEESGRLSGAIARFFMRLFGIENNARNLSRVGHIVRKAAHFNLFLLLGLTLGLALSPREKPYFAFLGLPIAMLSAAADEFHQHFVADRAGMWQDSVLDSCGALTGAVLAFLVLLLLRRVRRKREARVSVG